MWRREVGFTLVEVLIAIVVMAIALSFLNAAFFPVAQRSADPVLQFKANQLAQSLFNEILNKSFDEQSDRQPPWRRCQQSANAGLAACTNASSFGPDGGETRSQYDDVDDYHGLTLSDGNALGESVAGYYQGFSASVSVVYDGDYDDSTDDGNVQAKRITVTINTAQQQQFVYDAYRSNY